MDYFIQFEDGSDGYLSHHGVLGMKWGVRNAETKARYKREDRVFVSGSSKTQAKDSGYYRKKLPRPVRKELKGAMKSGSTVLVGDAPGVDRQVQDYLHRKKYKNVEVYSPGTKARYLADNDWTNRAVNDTEHEPGSKEWLAKKDVAMTNRATKGLAVTLDEGSTATRNNVERLRSQGKEASVYELSKLGKRYDRQVGKDDRFAKTRTGETMTLERDTGGFAVKGLGKISKGIRDEQAKTYNYNLKISGKKVGDLQMYQKPGKEMNIVWGSINEPYRRRGYMTAAIGEGERIAKELGNTKITGELVGNSPGGSIHKLAANRGYTKVGEIRTQEVLDIWGGLTLVEKKL